MMVLTTALFKMDQQKLTPRERQTVLEDLKQLICSAWQTDEIRQHRPTPVDEAKWGFTTIEQTLWNAVPKFMRELDEHGDRTLWAIVCLSMSHLYVSLHGWVVTVTATRM